MADPTSPLSAAYIFATLALSLTGELEHDLKTIRNFCDDLGLDFDDALLGLETYVYASNAMN